MKRLGKTLKTLLIIVFLSVLCVVGYFLFIQYFAQDADDSRDSAQDAGRQGVESLSQRQLKDEQELLEILYSKRWISEKDPKWLMDFERMHVREQLILLGPYPGGLEESRKFDIIAVNVEERSIVIHITEVYYTRYPDSENGFEESEKFDIIDRIIMEDNKLIYEYKYESPEEKVISIWTAED